MRGEIVSDKNLIQSLDVVATSIQEVNPELASRIDRVSNTLEASGMPQTGPEPIHINKDNQPDHIEPGRWEPEESRGETASRNAAPDQGPPPVDDNNDYVTVPDMEHSTADLPETGHDDSLDDYQQLTAAIKAIKTASKELANSGQRALARRLAELATYTASEFGPSDDFGGGDEYSTAFLAETGHDSAIDDHQQPTDLELWGTTKPDSDQVGPSSKSASTEDETSESEEDDDTSDKEASDSADKEAKKKCGCEGEDHKKGCKDASKTASSAPRLNTEALAKFAGLDEETIKTHPDGIRKVLSYLDGLKKGVDKQPRESGWGVLKASLQDMSKDVRGDHIAGSWRVASQDLGSMVELSLDTTSREGAQLSPGTVSFNLISENPRTKVATVEVGDDLVTGQTNRLELDAKKASRFAHAWGPKLNEIAESALGEMVV